MSIVMEHAAASFLAVRKCNGQHVPFNASKITAAILKAGQATGEFDEMIARKLMLRVLAMAHVSREVGLLRDVLHPTIHLGERLWRDRHPLATKMLKYLFRRRIDKIHAKYFTGSRTGEAFRKYKSYRLLLCRAAGTGSMQPPEPTPPERLPFDALQAEPRQAQTPFHLQILEDRS